MNFIKTLKFSVKGIDTTRYISNEVRNLLRSIERGKVPLSNRHEVSSRTPFVRDLRLSQIHKVVFGRSWRRERRRPLRKAFRGDKSAKGGDSSQMRLGVTQIGKGKKTPFPTDRILVVLSVAKDLRLISSPKDKKLILGRVGRWDFFRFR